MAQRWVECIEIVKSATVKTAFHSRLIAVFENDYVLTKISAPAFVFDSIKMRWRAPHATIIIKQYFFWDNAMVTGAFYDLWVTEMYFGSAPDWIPWMPNKMICHPGSDDIFEYEKAKPKSIAAPALESAMNFDQWKRVCSSEILKILLVQKSFRKDFVFCWSSRLQKFVDQTLSLNVEKVHIE